MGMADAISSTTARPVANEYLSPSSPPRYFMRLQLGTDNDFLLLQMSSEAIGRQMLLEVYVDSKPVIRHGG